MINEKDWEEMGRIAKIMQEHTALAQAEVQKQIKISKDIVKEYEAGIKKEKKNEQV